MDEAAPYQRLMKLIELELELARTRRLRELRHAVEQTGEYMKTLPHPAPASAQATLQRAMGLRSRVTIEARRARDEMQVARETVRRASTLARRYGKPQKSRYSTTA
jgi:hypothetical protein